MPARWERLPARDLVLAKPAPTDCPNCGEHASQGHSCHLFQSDSDRERAAFFRSRYYLPPLRAERDAVEERQRYESGAGVA